MIQALFILLAYLLGSIPTGLLLGKAFGVDIRTTGSGNIGATNVYRTMGKKLGILTLVGDCLKGLIPVLLARYYGLPDMWVDILGLAAFLGHVYTIFLGFKGGKGVATALGVFLGVAPLAVLCAIFIFAVVLWHWRYVSLASICAALAMPVFVAMLDQNVLIIAMTAIISTIVIHKHHDNIQRLRNGTENKFKG